MSIDITVDTATTFEAGAVAFNSVARLDDNTFIVAFADSDDANHGKAIVGTRSGYSITIDTGDVAEFLADSTDQIKIVSLSSSLIVIGFIDTNDGSDAKAIAGTISGTTITFGTAVKAADLVKGVSICPLDATHFIVSYSQNNITDKQGASVIGTVSGTTITFGDYQQFSDTALSIVMLSDKLDSTHFLVFYAKMTWVDYWPGNFRAAEVDIGTDTITFGAETSVEINPGTLSDPPVADYICLAALDDTNAVVAYRYQTGLWVRGIAIDAGTEAVTVSVADEDADSTNAIWLSICGMDASHWLVSMRDATDGRGNVIAGSSAAGAATFDAGSPTDFDTDPTTYTAITKLDDNYFLIAFNETP